MTEESPEIKALMKLHSGLPRQGPGSPETTLEALRLIPNLPNKPQVLDLGCGPGRASLALASHLDGTIVCIDRARQFLDELEQSAASLGLGERIQARAGDMAALDEPVQSADLIWAEGSIYCIGFDHGLSYWRQFLKPGGFIACTELSWLTDDRSKKAASFWKDNYPPMRSTQENIESAEALGYECVNHFVLPESCWWKEYYEPLLENIEKLRDEAKSDPNLASSVASMEEEIETFREAGNKEYGYVFYILKDSGETG